MPHEGGHKAYHEFDEVGAIGQVAGQVGHGRHLDDIEFGIEPVIIKSQRATNAAPESSGNPHHLQNVRALKGEATQTREQLWRAVMTRQEI